MDAAKSLKNVRAKKLGNLTRLRRRAFIVIDSKGSRSQLTAMLKELDEALEAIQEANDKYAACLQEEDEIRMTETYIEDAQKQHQDAVERIEEHLISRKDEAPSVASSAASCKTNVSNKAKIAAQVKHFEVQQLEKRQELERQEQEIKRKRQLQEAQDAEAAAKLEAQLLKDAEDDMNWDRRHDFVGESKAQDPTTPPQPVCGEVGQPATQCSAVHSPHVHACHSEPLFRRSLPILTLPKFNGNPGEWVRWFAMFRTLVHDQPSLTSTEKMAHLQAAVTGLAQRTIGGMLYRGELYEEAVKVLKNRFGRDDDIIHSNLDSIFSCPSPSHLDPASLERFQATVHCTVVVFQSMGHTGDLYSYENLRRIVEKLPTELKREWGEHVLNLEPEKPSLLHLDSWLNRQVRIALNVAAVSQQSVKQLAGRKDGEAKKLGGPRQQTVQRTALATEAQNTAGKVCICCEARHDVVTCPVFLNKTADEKAQLVASSGACFFCLKKGHAVRNCQSAKRCSIEGCRMKHHHLLHGSKRVGLRTSSQNLNPTSQHEGQRVVAAASVAGDPVTTLLQVVEVNVVGKFGNTRKVCALLDPGSQTSLVSEDVLKELGLQGEQQLLRLRNVEGSGTQQRTSRLQLNLLTDGEPSCPVMVPEAFSVKEINLTVPYFPVKRWRHVEGLKMPDCRGRKVELLLGANVMEAVLQLEVRTGNPGDPVAIRTVFGWTLTGSVAGLVPGHVRDVMLIHRVSEESELCTAMKEWWTTESFGSMFEGQVSCSQEDLRAQAILDKTTKLPDGRYEVGLLWKQDNPKLPDNRKMAEKRLQSLERNLLRDPAKAAAYEEVLMGYVAKNHARKVSPEELSRPCERRWLLPHHAVVSPRKVRVVFDATAQFAGTSLNDALITGPDLLQNLVGVLLRFREERVALVADVEEMFHQVRVIEHDQPALSFLWRHLDQTKTPDVFQMLVVIFGAKCSPTLANHALLKAAEDHQMDTTESRAAAEVVKTNFYMDDMLLSVKDTETAKNICQELTKLLAKGGFRLNKWNSNVEDVLTDIPETDRSLARRDPTCIGQSTQRALGCVWRPARDVLGVQVTSADVPATKRGVLSKLSMIFDPLGVVSPFVLRAKLLVQHLWKLKQDWDHPLSGEELAAWESWLAEMSHLEMVELPRCYKSEVPPDGAITQRELHVFCDSSERAFGAVAYIRTSCADGKHVASFVMSRTRLAPLKQLTIVRLELQAAVLGVRLMNFVRRELACAIDEVFLWTDSMVVLRFLQNESRRFHTFVANRISEIQSLSETGQWHHVPGDLNPADVCSRGLSGPSLRACSRWWSGPEFLSLDRDQWPAKEIEPALSAEDGEVKTQHETVFASQSSEGPILDPSRFSSWTKYRRTVAWVLRFSRNARQKKNSGNRVGGPLTASEVQYAENFVLRESQRTTYAAELKAIAKDSRLPEESTLLQLSPYVDEQGLLRARGRLGNAPLPEKSRHPILLGKDEDVTRLVITDAHKRVLHSGLEHTLSEVRLRFWIQKARSTVRKIIYRCAFCRNRRAQPKTPIMAALPESRFDMSRPFACVGLDYCGPLTVRKFRKTEKRYILLITCLATRALHLELVSSMDTDGFLMALRRFIARRGRPRVIWSDNGSNLVAGEKELRSCLESWNHAQINDELSQRSIEWRFTPPTGSHFGGIWERLVASVKRALLVVLGNQCVSEEVLHTVLLETEFTLNSRPLTYVSADINDPEPLTPNHFVLGRPEAAFPPGLFSDSEALGRSKWRQSQVLANQLWRRWQREYLPVLIQRKKWVHETRALQVGDVVLMIEQGSPRGYWPLAKVTEVSPSADGKVRSVSVKTSSGSVYRRPANKVCFLESCSPYQS